MGRSRGGLTSKIHVVVDAAESAGIQRVGPRFNRLRHPPAAVASRRSCVRNSLETDYPPQTAHHELYRVHGDDRRVALCMSWGSSKDGKGNRRSREF